MALAAPRDHTESSSDVVPELVEDDEDADVEGDNGDANPELRAGGDSSSVEQGWYSFRRSWRIYWRTHLRNAWRRRWCLQLSHDEGLRATRADAY